MAYDVIPTVCISIVAVFAVFGVTTYAVVKLLVTGRALVEKREPEEGRRRVVGIGER